MFMLKKEKPQQKKKMKHKNLVFHFWVNSISKPAYKDKKPLPESGGGFLSRKHINLDLEIRLSKTRILKT